MAPFQDMIRLAIVDDHPAIRLGLGALVRREPGFVLALNASDGPEATMELERHPIDIAVADFQLPSGDGIGLCRRLKKRGYCRAAVLYSAFANEWLTIAARVGGLDGVVNKGVPAAELFEALRLVGKGCTSFAETPVTELRQASELVEPEDQPVLGMLLSGTPERDIGSLLGVPPDAVQQRVERMLAVLKPRAKS